MRKYKKSTWLPVALFIYTTIMAVYFIPRNTEIGNAEKYVTIGVSYLIIALLWIVLRSRRNAENRKVRIWRTKNRIFT